LVTSGDQYIEITKLQGVGEVTATNFLRYVNSHGFLPFDEHNIERTPGGLSSGLAKENLSE
jgi:hypothetical protein